MKTKSIVWLGAASVISACQPHDEAPRAFPASPGTGVAGKADGTGAAVVFGQGQPCELTGACLDGLECLDWIDEDGAPFSTCEIACQFASDCPSGQSCALFSEDGEGICLRPVEEKIARGGECGSDRDCQDGLHCANTWVPGLPAGYRTCELACDPANPCPSGEACTPLLGPGAVCVSTPGTVPEGGDCSEEVCEAGLSCVEWVDPWFDPTGTVRRSCHRTCDAAGDCPQGYECNPSFFGPSFAGNGVPVCEPAQGTVSQGGDCSEEACEPGLTCVDWPAPEEDWPLPTSICEIPCELESDCPTHQHCMLGDIPADVSASGVCREQHWF